MRARHTLLIALVAAVGFLYLRGFYDTVDPEAVRAWIESAGAWGAVVFVVAYACLQPLGVRSIFFLLGAPLVWSPLHAALMSWVGAFIASVLAFGFARVVARDWAQEKSPPWLRRLDDRLARDGFRTVALLRLVFYTTPALQAALGVSRVRPAAFLLGTAVGIVPFTVLMTLVGGELREIFWRMVA